MSSELIGISHKNKFAPNESNKFSFIFSSKQKILEYNLYRIERNGEEEKRELLYEKITDSKFDFNFVPKTDKEKSFELLAEFNLDSIKVLIPAIIDMTLTE